MQAKELALARPHKQIPRLFIFFRKKSAAAARRALIRIRENEVAIIAIAAAAGFAVGAGVAAIGSAAALLHHIHTALAMFAKTESEVIPVVETAQNGRVLGCVSEAYLWKRYNQGLEKHRIDETNGGVFSPESSGI